VWRLIVVYVSPYEDHKLEFIFELHRVMPYWQGPTLVGGDFNLVRTQREKSNNNINFTHSEAFNDWINTWGFIEIKDPSRSYTWSNNQEHPIMAILDRALVSTEWDAEYPLTNVVTLPKGVSDHNPIKITFGRRVAAKNPVFRFEKWWLQEEGFKEMIKRIWDCSCPLDEPIEVWQFKTRLLRRKLKGWNINVEAALKKEKKSSLSLRLTLWIGWLSKGSWKGVKEIEERWSEQS
jgi:hypothetical protein